MNAGWFGLGGVKQSDVQRANRMSIGQRLFELDVCNHRSEQGIVRGNYVYSLPERPAY